MNFDVEVKSQVKDFKYLGCTITPVGRLDSAVNKNVGMLEQLEGSDRHSMLQESVIRTKGRIINPVVQPAVSFNIEIDLVTGKQQGS